MGVESGLMREVAGLKKSGVGVLVESRMREFGSVRGRAALFKELCFCILTANYDAGRAVRIQREIGRGFLTLKEARLAGRLRSLGYRYPNARASYIVGARRHIPCLESILKCCDRREWLVKNVRGLGYKEASHFLRNVGFRDYAIVDFHILDVLVKYGLVSKPKSLNRCRYLEVESLLRGLARRLKLSLAELDLYLWYLETGKVLK